MGGQRFSRFRVQVVRGILGINRDLSLGLRTRGRHRSLSSVLSRSLVRSSSGRRRLLGRRISRDRSLARKGDLRVEINGLGS